MGMASVQTQLEVQVREHIAKYYEGWTVCEDATCGHRTRMMGVYGRRCLRPGCLATVTFEVSSPFVCVCLATKSSICSIRTHSCITSCDTTYLCSMLQKLWASQVKRQSTVSLPHGTNHFAKLTSLSVRPDLQSLQNHQQKTCDALKGVVEKYLDQSGRRWVQMSTLFSFMKV